MMLDNYVRDFKALIDWIQLQEKLEKTDAQNRWSFLQLCAILPNFFFMYTNFVELLTPKFNFLNVNFEAVVLKKKFWFSPSDQHL